MRISNGRIFAICNDEYLSLSLLSLDLEELVYVVRSLFRKSSTLIYLRLCFFLVPGLCLWILSRSTFYILLYIKNTFSLYSHFHISLLSVVSVWKETETGTRLPYTYNTYSNRRKRGNDSVKSPREQIETDK